ncbi:MAG TPA: hypothetical protein P5116_02695 [Eubacteriales bacterium]|nr:hypothetical protein [Clostridia bacterium]HRV72771.1 hypothetical protein [Eubacteriales bacterium]
MKKVLIIVGALAGVILILAILILTEVIPLDKLFSPETVVVTVTATPAAEVEETNEPAETPHSIEVPSETEEPPATVPPTEMPTWEPMSYTQQIENLVTGLRERDAEKVVMVYYEAYWTASGMMLYEANELMADNLEELNLPNDLAYSIVSERAADADELGAIQKEFGGYDVDASRIASAMVVTISLTGTDFARELVCHFVQIDGAWFLVDDIFQLFY